MFVPGASCRGNAVDGGDIATGHRCWVGQQSQLERMQQQGSQWQYMSQIRRLFRSHCPNGSDNIVEPFQAIRSKGPPNDIEGKRPHGMRGMSPFQGSAICIAID